MNKNELLVMYGRSVPEMTGELLRMADLAAMIPGKDTLIGIKPNLLGPIPADEGATTHPEIVEGIIRYLREHGYRRLVVLESSWVGDRTKDSVSVCGYDTMLKCLGVPFWDLQEDAGIARDCCGMELKICERVEQIGFLINVPVLKGHCQTKMTCALKNLKGLIPNSEKRRFHRLGLHKPIGHLGAGISQDFILVDDLCSDLTFEDGGHPVRQDRLIAAIDPVLCDTYACHVIGISENEVPYLGIAAELGGYERDLEHADIRVYMEKAAENGKPCFIRSQERLPLPYTAMSRGRSARVFNMAEEIDACSACYGTLVPVLDQLEREGLLQALPGPVCIGQGYRGRGGKTGVGSCTALFDRNLPGCPPGREEVEAFLRKLIAEEAKTER